MDFTIEKETRYIPDVYGNRELGPDEQVVVTIRTPNASETASIAGAMGNPDSTNIIQGVSRFVTKIENLYVNGVAVANGREMASCEGMYVFALNIGSHILGMLTEIDKNP